MPYTPKTFAVGEILTAQDVNDHLVNTIRRTILQDGEVITSTSEAVVNRALAIVDESPGGDRTVTLALHLSDLYRPPDTYFEELGILADDLHPTISVSTFGHRASTRIKVSIESTGRLILRYLSGNVSGQAIFLNSVYPIVE